MIILYEYLKKNKLPDDFPLNDKSAWLLYPNFRLIYNKLILSDIQELSNNPIPIIPLEFPVIIKPIINLDGMSKGFHKIDNEEDYIDICKNNILAGSFYQKYLTGTNYNYDIIFKNGKIIDYFCMISHPDKEGMFKYHELELDSKINQNFVFLLEDLLQNYTGFVNIEVIGDYIIEGHLRLNGDLFIYSLDDFYKLVNFSVTKEYQKIKLDKKIYFIPLFLKDKNINFKSIEYLLKEDFVIDYKFDNINSMNQNITYKRFLYFRSYNKKKSLELQNKIYKELDIKL